MEETKLELFVAFKLLVWVKIIDFCVPKKKADALRAATGLGGGGLVRSAAVQPAQLSVVRAGQRLQAGQRAAAEVSERTQSLTGLCVVCVAGGGHCDRQHDHHLGEGAGHRLQQAVHVVRHFHHDQKTGETKARRVQLP